MTLEVSKSALRGDFLLLLVGVAPYQHLEYALYFKGKGIDLLQ